MKRVISIILIFSASFLLYSEDNENNDNKKTCTPIFYGKIGYSFIMDSNISAGLDLALDVRHPLQWEGVFIEHVFGLEYQHLFKTDESILRINYVKTLFFFAGLGGGFLYNFTENEIGIAPQIGLVNYIFYAVVINCYYRYNLIFNDINRNFHEIFLTCNIVLPIDLGRKRK